MPNSCRLLLVMPMFALVPALAGAAEATTPTPAQAATTAAPAKLPDWAPKPRPHVIEDRLRLEVNLLGASPSTKLRVDESPTEHGTEPILRDGAGFDDLDDDFDYDDYAEADEEGDPEW